MKIDKIDWQIRLLKLAQHISGWSKDPSTKVGAVLATSDAKVISNGYNGLPINFDDNLIADRDYKIENVIHAELNCLANMVMKPLNVELYLFVTHSVCPECAKIISAHSFIKRVYYVKNEEFEARWNATRTESFFHNTNIEYIGINSELLNEKQ